MSRLYFMTFLGKKRWTDDVHPHESPLTMTIPMMVLAVGSAFLGLILGPTNFIANWLNPVFGIEEAPEEHPVIAPIVITERDPAPGRRRRGPGLGAATCATRSRRRPRPAA